jgi:hypothetical protein
MRTDMRTDVPVLGAGVDVAAAVRRATPGHQVRPDLVSLEQWSLSAWCPFLRSTDRRVVQRPTAASACTGDDVAHLVGVKGPASSWCARSRPQPPATPAQQPSHRRVLPAR